MGLISIAMYSHQAPKEAATSVSPVARFMIRDTPYCSVNPIAISA